MTKICIKRNFEKYVMYLTINDGKVNHLDGTAFEHFECFFVQIDESVEHAL
jgi:hypothetical protein